LSSVGQELLDVPFSEMIKKMASAIAEAQLELDRSAIESARLLLDRKFNITTEIRQTVDKEGKVTKSEPGRVETLSLFELGFTPNFYQFTESIIEVKMAISAKTVREQEGTLGFRPFVTPLSGRYTQTFSYQVEGASTLRTVMKPVPAPSRIQPTVTVESP